MTKNLPINLVRGTAFQDKFGNLFLMAFGARLTYFWGAKGSCGMAPEPRYAVPVLGGHVCIYVTPEQIIG